MRKCFIVFDQLPSIHDGGLIATYIQLVQLIQKDFDVQIVSVFGADEKVLNEKVFNECPITILNPCVIDNRFFHFVSYLKQGNFKKALWAIWSMMVFFTNIPALRVRMKKMVNADDVVIVSSPAAAMFMHKNLRFLLDVHTNFEYFFGKNLVGRLQTLLMKKPTLTVFRNKRDAEKASSLFASEYLYNCVSEKIEGHLSKEKKRILFVGRLHEHKNPLRLIECAALLKQRMPDFHLDIYGTGELEQALRQKIREHQLEENVHLCGFMTDKTLYSRYQCLWLTSELEGFGLVIVEAKANHVPTISVEWAEAVHEVIHSGQDGFVVCTNEELVECTMKLLNDEALNHQFSESAYSDYKARFSETMYLKKFYDLLQHL